MSVEATFCIIKLKALCLMHCSINHDFAVYLHLLYYDNKFQKHKAFHTHVLEHCSTSLIKMICKKKMVNFKLQIIKYFYLNSHRQHKIYSLVILFSFKQVQKIFYPHKIIKTRFTFISTDDN